MQALILDYTEVRELKANGEVTKISAVSSFGRLWGPNEFRDDIIGNHKMIRGNSYWNSKTHGWLEIDAVHYLGGRFFVREQWAVINGICHYKADYSDERGENIEWVRSLRMPFEYSRYIVEVTAVKVARAADFPHLNKSKWNRNIKVSERHMYGLQSNPYVWVITVKAVI